MKVVPALLLLLLFAAAQQPVDKSKRPSPPASAECKFADGNTIRVDYSQPSMRGRKIYGGLVPYGQVWRTGANEATTFVPSANVTVGGTSVQKGGYTMFTLPSEATWKLIINEQTGQWGTKYDQTQDLARIDMKTEKLSTPVEKFTISFDEHDGDGCAMRLDWASTRESVEIKEQK